MQWRGVSILQEKWCSASCASVGRRERKEERGVRPQARIIPPPHAQPKGGPDPLPEPHKTQLLGRGGAPLRIRARPPTRNAEAFCATGKLAGFSRQALLANWERRGKAARGRGSRWQPRSTVDGRYPPGERGGLSGKGAPHDRANPRRLPGATGRFSSGSSALGLERPPSPSPARLRLQPLAPCPSAAGEVPRPTPASPSGADCAAAHEGGRHFGARPELVKAAASAQRLARLLLLPESCVREPARGTTTTPLAPRGEDQSVCVRAGDGTGRDQVPSSRP